MAHVILISQQFVNEFAEVTMSIQYSKTVPRSVAPNFPEIKIKRWGQELQF